MGSAAPRLSPLPTRRPRHGRRPRCRGARRGRQTRPAALDRGRCHRSRPRRSGRQGDACAARADRRGRRRSRASAMPATSPRCRSLIWSRCSTINLRAPMLMARAALPPMLDQGSGVAGVHHLHRRHRAGAHRGRLLRIEDRAGVLRRLAFERRFGPPESRSRRCVPASSAPGSWSSATFHTVVAGRARFRPSRSPRRLSVCSKAAPSGGPNRLGLTSPAAARRRLPWLYRECPDASAESVCAGH